MSKLDKLIEMYGAEEIIARVLEQARLMAVEDVQVADTAKRCINDIPVDTEYIYSICEYGNLVSYTSGNPIVSDGEWDDEPEIFKDTPPKKDTVTLERSDAKRLFFMLEGLLFDESYSELEQKYLSVSNKLEEALERIELLEAGYNTADEDF